MPIKGEGIFRSIYYSPLPWWEGDGEGDKKGNFYTIKLLSKDL
jgi:hypothetical protein